MNVHVPLNASQNAAGVSGADVKEIAVTLPEGVVLNPAAADGLQACSEQQIGYLLGQSSPPGEPHFTANLPTPFCPDAAKVGTVRLKVPILPNPLEGAVYLADQDANPFSSLIAMYIVAKDPVSGVLVKLAGNVTLDPATGRISAFTMSPQAPFEDAELHFFGGERAPLATPAMCGTYTTEATFTPWSGGPPVRSLSSFTIETGVGGTPCPSSRPFAPSLAAGTTNINAGAFSPLSTTISRQDGNQDIQTVRLHMAPGLSGILAGVKLCPEAQANAGTCGPESLIGHTIVSVGLGGDPFSVTAGQVFLTEKYGGGQFGLSIVNAADAGPFHLGKVIVRASIAVDRTTAALTITTDPIPHILKGIPLQIKDVNVTIDRPGFTFNPTNCNPMSITGSIGSTEGASSPVAVPFQVTNCKNLPFSPKFSASIGAKPTKANGESLRVKIVEGVAGEANVHLVKVALPKQLPSRLTTLQEACLAATFNANPANCPAGSIVGHAKAITPILPVPLEGPAYFVSHGGEKFPDLTIVLQGYGVRVDLVGSTFISKAGVTSSTFKTVPDAPVISFELTLPQGPFSALTALGDACKLKLAMPTEVIAQNGAVIHQVTPITVTGCAKSVKARAKGKKHKKAGKKGGKKK